MEEASGEWLFPRAGRKKAGTTRPVPLSRHDVVRSMSHLTTDQFEALSMIAVVVVVLFWMWVFLRRRR
jgi:hypothetical protein